MSPIYELDIKKLRRQEESTIKRNARWYKELEPVINDVDKLPYAIIKGEVLSVMAYGEKGFRNSQDIDMLIDRKHIKTISEIFLKHGFREALFDENGNPRSLTREERIMFMNSHQIVPYYKKLENCDNDIMYMDVDINVDILWGEYTGKRIDIDSFLSDTSYMDMYDCHIKALPPVKGFIQLCLHHYKEMNGLYYLKRDNPFSEIMFQDIYYLYNRHIKDKIDLLLQFVQEYSLQEVFYYILYYTNLIFPDNTLSKDIRLFETDDGIKKLNTYGLNEKERKEWNIDFFNRMNHPDMYSIIEPQLTADDKQKIEIALSSTI